MFNLKDIQPGKYILIDFWASWCGPCRKETPYLQAAYEKHKGQGVYIVSISLDQDKQQWITAIKQDSMFWHNVSDLKGFDNKLAKSLFIHSLPDNFLLAPSGKIVARNLRRIELESALEDLF